MTDKFKPADKVIEKMTDKKSESAMFPKLRPSNKEFLRNWIQTGNGTQSWMDANPKSTRNSAARSASRMLAREDAKEYIQYVLKEYQHLIEMEMWEINRELKKMAMNPFDSPTKFNALKLLGQAQGEFTERVEVTNKDIVVGLVD